MNLHDDVFPVILRICITPGLNLKELQKFGYEDSIEYFIGRRLYKIVRLHQSYNFEANTTILFLVGWDTPEKENTLMLIQKVFINVN